MVAEREVILPLPSPLMPARNVRSTIVLSSYATIREAGFADTYLALLPPNARETIQSSVVGMWIPMDLALAHYNALEGLGLSADQQVAYGRATFDKTAGTLLGTAIKLSRNAGVSPWTVMPLFQRFWLRGLDGGGIAVYKLGPKEAQVDCAQVAANDVRYFRNAVRGLLMSVLDLFCAKSYVKEIPGPRAPGAFHVRAQWA